MDAPTLSFQRNDNGGCYLINKTRTIRGLSKGEVCVTYTLVLPHVFGDNSEHKITTYWEFPFRQEDNANNDYEIERYPKCTRVLFDEREATFEASQTGKDDTLINIVL